MSNYGSKGGGQPVQTTRAMISGFVRLVPTKGPDVAGDVAWADAVGIALDVSVIDGEDKADSRLRRFYPWSAVVNVDTIRKGGDR